MNTKRFDDMYWWLGLAVIAAVLIYLLNPILTPFLLAAVLAYICNPLVDSLQRRKIPRTLGVVLAMLLLLGLSVLLVLILLPVLHQQLVTLAERLPAYLDAIKSGILPWLHARFGLELQLDATSLVAALTENLPAAKDLAVKLLPSLKSGGLALIAFLMNLLLVPVVLFYFLRDWNGLIKRIEEIIPRGLHAEITGLAVETDRVLGEFLRGQISVMLLMSAYYAVALWLAGLDYALPIAVLAGFLVFVPYLGMIVGLTLATLAGFLQFPDFIGLVPVWVAFAVGQALEGMVVTPWLVGERVELHPVAVIFALLAFGLLFGFFGVLLALPATSVLLVWLRHLRRRYIESEIYKS